MGCSLHVSESSLREIMSLHLKHLSWFVRDGKVIKGVSLLEWVNTAMNVVFDVDSDDNISSIDVSGFN